MQAARRGGIVMKTIGSKIVKRLEQLTGRKAKWLPCPVRLRGKKEVQKFMKTLEDARKAKPSTTIYGHIQSAETGSNIAGCEKSNKEGEPLR